MLERGRTGRLLKRERSSTWSRSLVVFITTSSRSFDPTFRHTSFTDTSIDNLGRTMMTMRFEVEA